jgi:hypothetical protein
MEKISLPEKNKKEGVHYAVTSDGVELPVVDVTHPAFAVTLSPAEQHALVDDFMRQGMPLADLPKPLRKLLLRFFLRGSVLAEGVRRSEGTFMTGMHTYLLKLGPQMLGNAYAKPVDRRIAAALPALGVRLRLQDVAQLMADSLLPRLDSDRRRAVHFVNIAGGPGIDSLNALILLSRQPGILSGREISIDVLDLDVSGPAFGEAALSALSEDGGPLRGIRVGFRRIRYDWAKAEDLKPVLNEAHLRGALGICSSEGGLFEYGSDDEILANLQVLRECQDVVAVVGSVTRADEPAQRLHQTNRAALRPRGIEAFRILVQRSGWRVVRVVERPFSDQVVLE